MATRISAFLASYSELCRDQMSQDDITIYVHDRGWNAQTLREIYRVSRDVTKLDSSWLGKLGFGKVQKDAKRAELMGSLGVTIRNSGRHKSIILREREG